MLQLAQVGCHVLQQRAHQLWAAPHLRNNRTKGREQTLVGGDYTRLQRQAAVRSGIQNTQPRNEGTRTGADPHPNTCS
jgi:hypothetical protein